MLVTFSDDPLVAGTRIKAAHVAELVAAINDMRAAGGLPPQSARTTPERDRPLVRVTS